jgi:GNAT superfamily N-acetyltransferase
MSEETLERTPGSLPSRAMNTLVRLAMPDDSETIATVHIRGWQGAYRGQLPDQYLDSLDHETERRSAFWRKEISTPRSKRNEIWVVECRAQVEGFAATGPARNAGASTGEVYAIYVNPIHWGQGLGRALFAHATNRLAALGYSTAILWVLASNERARRFYEVSGWAADGGTKQETICDGIVLREVSYSIRFHQENEES